RVRSPHVHLRRRQIRVGARRDDDLVLAAVSDNDQRDAGVYVPLVDPADAAQVDSNLRKTGESLVGEVIDADHRDEADGRAQAGRGDCLVRSLPAGNSLEDGVRDGLARPGQALAAGDEVEVDRPDDGHARPAAESGWRGLQYGSYLAFPGAP